jgi:hypothetical protein
MRFPIRIDGIWRAPMLVGGATKQTSYVDVGEEEVTVRFGYLFNRTIPKSEILGAAPRRWPLWYGLGWRSNLRGVIGLVGSYENVVEMKLATRGRAWGVFPCDRIAVSLEDPEGFIAAVTGNGAGNGTSAAPAVKAVKAARTSTRAAAKPKRKTAAKGKRKPK